MMGSVLQFKCKNADRSEEISRIIFKHIHLDGADAFRIVEKLLDEFQDQSPAQLLAGYSLAHRVLRVLQTLHLDRLHGGDGGAA
jgi:hypothetical protein